MKHTQKKYQRLWLPIALVAVLVAGIVFLLVKSRTDVEKKEKGAEFKMIGLEEGIAPEESRSYRHVQGIIDLQHWKTKKGVNVYFVHVPTIPMVDIELIFDAGAARNGDKGGLAYLTNKLLAEGTSELNADTVAENFDRVGAIYEADSYRDMALVHLRSLSTPEQLVPAVKTMAAIVSHPIFPESGFRREQQNMLSKLKRQAEQPNDIALRALYNAMYPNQPYSSWVIGDEQSVNTMTAADLKNFHKTYYVAANVDVIIVGDVSSRDADAIAQTLTNNLLPGEKAVTLPKVVDMREKVFKKIDFPSKQTHILIGQPTIRKDDPDYYALYVGNHILGGNSSTNRIFNTVRNQYGLAYSAYASLIPMKERGPYIMGCQTRNEQAEKAQNLINDLLVDFITNGPTQEELDQAKKNLLGGFALQFDSNLSILREVASLAFYNLPINKFNEFKPAVEKITIQNIKDAFERKISPDRYAIIIVGGKVTKKDVTPPFGPQEGSTVGTDKDYPVSPGEGTHDILKGQQDDPFEDEDDDIFEDENDKQNVEIVPSHQFHGLPQVEVGTQQQQR